MNMLTTIIAKSDQLNADDLLGRDLTITVTKVIVDPKAEQPASIGFEGDNGKPWKPCKSMRRVLVHAWGPDASAYAGRSLTLFRDPDVRFGSLDVGGIRISHMTHIDKQLTMALTATRGNKKPFTVKPLKLDSPVKSADPPAGAVKWAETFMAACGDAPTMGTLDDLLLVDTHKEGRKSVRKWPALSARVEAAVTAAVERLQAGASETAPDGDAGTDMFPGDLP